MENINRSVDISFISSLLKAIIVGMTGLIALDAALNVASWILTSVVSRYPSMTEYTFLAIVVIILNILAYVAVGILAVKVNKGALKNSIETTLMGVIAGAIVNLVPANIADALHWLAWAFTGNYILLGNPYINLILILLGLAFAVPLSMLGAYLGTKRQGASAYM